MEEIAGPIPALYQNLKYRYGFFASIGKAPIINPYWGRYQVSDFYFTYDKTLEFSIREGVDSWIIVYGKIISTRMHSILHGEVTNHLFELLNRDKSHFLDELDYCCGRFVIVYLKDGEINIINDATGMKSIYYSKKCVSVAASHYSILSDYLDLASSTAVHDYITYTDGRSFGITCLPGFITTKEGLYCLCPNTELSLQDGKVKRYFPRADLVRTSASEAIEKATSLMQALITKLSENYPLAISITAGLDSRVTTAAARNIAHRVFFFTNNRTGLPSHTIDCEVANKILQDADLPHFILPLEEVNNGQRYGSDDFNRFKDIMSHNVDIEAQFQGAYEYYQQIPHGFLHIRSNIAEICRARYHAPPFESIGQKPASAESFAAIHNLWTNRKWTNFSVEMFQQYIDETGLLEHCFNYDPYALYYWEHLMGRWHASALQESDVAFDTVSLYNCRAILQSFLAAPFEDQVSKRLMYGAIEKMWPDLLAYPINPKKETPASSQPFVQPSLEIKSQGSKYVFTVDVEESDLLFAFYVYKDGSIIEKKWYTAENQFSIEFIPPGFYKVRFFIVKNKDYEKGNLTDEQKVTGWFDPVLITATSK